MVKTLTANGWLEVAVVALAIWYVNTAKWLVRKIGNDVFNQSMDGKPYYHRAITMGVVWGLALTTFCVVFFTWLVTAFMVHIVLYIRYGRDYAI